MSILQILVSNDYSAWSSGLATSTSFPPAGISPKERDDVKPCRRRTTATARRYASCPFTSATFTSSSNVCKRTAHFRSGTTNVTCRWQPFPVPCIGWIPWKLATPCAQQCQKSRRLWGTIVTLVSMPLHATTTNLMHRSKFPISNAGRSNA